MPGGDELRGDGDGDLLGRDGAEVEPDGRPQTRERGLAHALGAQRGDALGVRAARAHRADVREREVQREPQERHVELRVVREHGDGGPRVEPARGGLRGEIAVGPVDDDLRLGKRRGSANTSRASTSVTR